MTELARELSFAGVEIHYVTTTNLSDERRAMGWVIEETPELSIHYISSPEDARELVGLLPSHAIHITQGVRSNGLIAHVQKKLIADKLRHYPIMEKVDLRGFLGWVKSIIYRLRFNYLAGKVDGILAIGDTTRDWIKKRSPTSLQVYPFAYFLTGRHEQSSVNKSSNYQFIFVGSLIERKRADLLLSALKEISSQPFELQIIGAGPQRVRLEEFSDKLLPGKVVFIGTLEMQEAIARIAAADCLVLPSDHDGWGAVVSEAQINGTPAICSSECGAAGTVRASGFGSVFTAGNAEDLSRCLEKSLETGKVDDNRRNALARWATCLTAKAGARYLLKLTDRDSATKSPLPPWEETDG